MSGFKPQVWVTSALTDQDVAAALTLCFSLRRTQTSRKVAVITSRKLSTPLKDALHYGFDFIFYLEEDRNTAGLKIEDFAKLTTLTLKPFDKCVFLSSNMLVMKNCDQIFDEYNVTQGFVWTEKGDSSIFMVRPSMETFKVFMGAVLAKNGSRPENYLKTLASNKAGKTVFLDEKYSRLLSPQNGILLGNENDFYIINLIDYPNLLEINMSTDGLGLVAQVVLEHLKSIYKWDVSPLLEWAMNPAISSKEYNTLPRLPYQTEPVAIIGMSCRFPGSDNLSEFWDLLANGKDGTGTPPDFRWTREHSIRTGPENRLTNAGFLKCPVDSFDAKFFGISPKEVVCMDPQHRLLHELVWEGLEDAAINPQFLEGTNGGVYIGSWTNDYKEIIGQSGNLEFYRIYMGNSIGASAARISHLLGMTGPSIATESGCSSAMVAVHMACKSLQSKETDFALACGVNLLLHPFDQDVMPMVVSPDGHCRTFDANANGFARGEGCGVLVLKRLSDAVRDKDNIWALIRGSSMTQEGVSNSMGTPTVHCEALAMTQALEDGGVLPEQVSYVETHGTGTIVGDPLEVAAIAKAYHSKQRKEPLIIGSVKTNVGHTESCSGITGIMKVVLAMHNEIIPQHINFETLNPEIDLEAIPAAIPLKPTEWRKVSTIPRLAGVSSFGITGTDAHVILEEAPTLPPNSFGSCDMERPLHIMKISAKSDEAMELLLEKYKEYFGSNKNEIEFADVAYTANVGRADFSQRAVLIASSSEQAVEMLEQKTKLITGEVAAEASNGKVCFLFTGQGSQYPGMAKELYETSPVFRIHFQYCEKVLKEKYHIDITKVLWSTEKSDEVSRTIYSQTSIFCVEYALLKLWESWGFKADFALGHSLGEFAAAVCAGLLTVEDAIKLVAERSSLIEQLPRGKMLVIKAEKKRVDILMSKFASGDKTKVLDYAAVNSPEQTVVAGDSEVVLEFSEFCKNSSLKCIILEATHAFHSKHMDPILNDYRKVAKTVLKLSGNDCKFISGTRGTLVSASHLNDDYWVDHTREKVSFLDASKKAVELGCKTFIEIGPQPVLSALTMMNNEAVLLCVPSMKKNEGDWETLFSTLAKLYVKGVNIDWNGLEQFYPRQKVKLPNYPFIGKKFWPDSISSTGLAIHPLVGSVIANASPTKLFQSGLNLRVADYIKDHAIGEHFIFPGAGYLEMCLAAGLATIDGATDTLSPPTRPMKIENLFIQAPFELHESKMCQVQTVTELNTNKDSDGDWNDISIKVFRRLEGEGAKWLPLAKATFSPLPTTSETNIQFDVEHFKTTILTPPTDEKALVETYERLATIGLKFGPNFRSIEQAWRSEVDGSLIAKLKLPSGSGNEQVNGSSNVGATNQYIMHPVILDAMIQAITMLRHNASNMKSKLHVPIKVSKFLWLAGINSNELYISAFHDENNPESNGSSLLVDSSGKVLAFMSGTELTDTTAKAIDSILEHQTLSMPDMWEETWKKTMSPLLCTEDLEKASTIQFFSEEFLEDTEERFNKPPPEIQEPFDILDNLTYINMLCALYELGWKPKLNETFVEETLFKELGIIKDYRKYFGFMLQVFEAEGILKKESQNGNDSTWKVVSQPMTLDEGRQIVSGPLYSQEMVEKFRSTLLLLKVGETLSAILKGEQDALYVLFPEDNKAYPNVADFYMEYGKFFRIFDFVGHVGRRRLERAQGLRPEGGRLITRVLEIGAGTGAFTLGLLEMIEEMGLEFELHYTDISAAFFPAAEKKFEKYLKSIKFRKLNIEEDPIEQGFTPEYFDYVCASDVIHATKNIKESMAHMRMLLKPHGRLDLNEMTRVHRFVTYFFGLLEGFWRFEDFELRTNHCTLSKEQWTNVFQQSGFTMDGTFSVLDNYHSYLCARRTTVPLAKLEMCLSNPPSKAWLLFGSLNNTILIHLKAKIWDTSKRQVILISGGSNYEERHDSFVIRKDKEEDFTSVIKSMVNSSVKIEGILWCWNDDKNTNQEDILQPFFHMTKALYRTEGAGNPRVICVAKSVVPIENSDGNYPHFSTLWGYNKTLKNENVQANIRCIQLADDDLGVNRLKEIFYEIWNTDKEVQIAYHGSNRYIPKFAPYKAVNTALKLPNGTDRYQLILPTTNSIADLQFGVLEPFELKEDEVEIRIKASALNFRDILSVLKPIDKFKDINSVGFDFAGVVKRVGEKVTKWKAGDKVFSCNTNLTALPSHVKLHQDMIMAIPEDITYCEAATLPAVYITSYVCLVDVAKIKKEDVVLIHTASGGVGLSAIEICKDIGCTIIATAGSKRKQNYLRNLGIKHIFHSRNTQFGDEILELTNGRGVDVVLNSLTSEGFKEATLKACAKGARFIEMSKLNIWTDEDVKELRPDVEYTIVDVSSTKDEEWKRLLDKVQELQDKNVVKPIPYVRFDGQNIREALTYMQKAKHIGKVVCQLPEMKTEEGEMKVYTSMFNENATYLITGGLGGIGFVICQWMVEKGAKHVILVGRSPPNSSTLSKIKEMNLNGANIIVEKLDVGDFEECKYLLKNRMEELQLPKLRGVMHAAGTLSDGVIVYQEWSKLSSPFNTKIKGTLNLHELTKHLQLEHFVLFSSVASLFGPPGQCNHAAGNHFEDSFAHYRNSIGLPATTVNWGPWGEVGVAVEIDIPGLKSLSNLQGVTGLEHAMKTQRVQTAIINVESFVLLSKLFPYVAIYLDERVWKTSMGSGGTGLKIKSEEFWQQYDALVENEEKIDFVKSQIKNILRYTLKLENDEVIDDDKNLQELGMDSLMYVEIKNSVQALLGERVTVNANTLKDKNTVNLLSEALVQVIEGKNSENLPLKMEQVNELIREDALLPETINPKPKWKAVKENKISTVLLTGVTGTMGPYVLRELTSLPQIKKVVCLMRPKKSGPSSEERLQAVLTKRNLLSQVDMGKVKYVTGNVAEPLLGIAGDAYTELAEEVDAIVHFAACVRHTEHYRKRDSEDTRMVNIQGTKNVLEFASEKKLKHVMHASALLAVNTVDAESGTLSENWPEVGDYDDVTNYGYPITKFVGDLLMKQAVERGIPVKAFRFPFVSGESGTGQCEIDSNHMLLRYLFIMKNGIMPSTPMPNSMLPVDICCEAAVNIFFNEKAKPGIFNIAHDKPDLDQEFLGVARKFGYEVECIELPEFVKRVKEDKDKDSPIALFRDIYEGFTDEELMKTANLPTNKQWLEGNDRFFVSKKVLEVLPQFYKEKCTQATMDYVYNDLMFIKGQGWFDKFGL